MSDFSKGKIYKLTCIPSGQYYIGSTVQSLSQRKRDHNAAYKKWVAGKTTHTSACEIVKGGNFTIELLENYPCITRRQLLSREAHWQKKYAGAVNINRNRGHSLS